MRKDSPFAAVLPTLSPLEILVDALPDAALRAVIMALVQNVQNGQSGAAAAPPPAPLAPAAPLAARKRRGGWPKGVRRRKPAAIEAFPAGKKEESPAEGKFYPAGENNLADAADAKPSDLVAAMVDTAAAKRDAARVKANEYRRGWRRRRAQRAQEAAQQVKSNGAGFDKGSAGNGADAGPTAAHASTSARRFWDRAAALAPGKPWRCISREFNLNEQLCLDSYRLKHLPPGIEADAVERFLELRPAT
jgi:hypothetical protein